MKYFAHSIVCNYTFTIVFNHFYNSIPSFFHRAENIAKKTYRDVCSPGQYETFCIPSLLHRATENIDKKHIQLYFMTFTTVFHPFHNCIPSLFHRAENIA